MDNYPESQLIIIVVVVVMVFDCGEERGEGGREGAIGGRWRLSTGPINNNNSGGV